MGSVTFGLPPAVMTGKKTSDIVGEMVDVCSLTGTCGLEILSS
jgi:hypothetical protein